MNCEEDPSVEHGVVFGEELRASPAKRVREISVHPVSTRVVRPLFQVAGMPSSSKGSQGHRSNQEVS
jgi:hypothetical protein